MENTFINLICEEISLLGGKVIHIDTNASLEEAYIILKENISKYPNAKWELYPMQIKM